MAKLREVVGMCGGRWDVGRTIRVHTRPVKCGINTCHHVALGWPTNVDWRVYFSKCLMMVEDATLIAFE